MHVDTLRDLLLQLQYRFQECAAAGLRAWWDEATSNAFARALTPPREVYTNEQAREGVDAVLKRSREYHCVPSASDLSGTLQRIADRDRRAAADADQANPDDGPTEDVPAARLPREWRNSSSKGSIPLLSGRIEAWKQLHPGEPLPLELRKMEQRLQERIREREEAAA